MGKRIFQVYISGEESSSEACARLDLPASPWQLLDALDKARFRDADSLYLEIDEYYDYEDLANILPTVDLSLLELNDLAQRLSSLDARQRTAFEGILRMEMPKGDEEITVQRLRDFTESVDCCHVVPEAKNVYQLGRFYAENGFVPEIEDISEQVFELLDFYLIGRRIQQEECGIFTSQGYVVQNELFKEAPKITDTKPPVPDYTILLNVSRGTSDDPADDNAQEFLLPLPASKEALDETAEALGAASWEELGWSCVDCCVPSLAVAITESEDFQSILTIAQVLSTIGPEELPCYKAVLESTGCATLEDAAEIAGHLDAYQLFPQIASPAELARTELDAAMTGPLSKALYDHVDLYALGQDLLRVKNYRLSSYGLIQRRDGQPLHSYGSPEPTQGMELR